MHGHMNVKKNQVCHRTSHQFLQVKVHHTRIRGSTYGLSPVSHHVTRIALLLQYFFCTASRAMYVTEQQIT